MEVPTHPTPSSVIFLLIQSRAKCGLDSRYRRHEMLARMWGSGEELGPKYEETKLAENGRKNLGLRASAQWTLR